MQAKQLYFALLALFAFAAFPAAAIAADPVVAAAGDIACDPANAGYNAGAGTATACRQRYTSDLLVNSGLSRVLVLGDNQYDDGTLAKYQSVYDPTWGRLKSITSPVAGNHEPGDSAGYFDYFNGVGNANGRAGERGKGYYSYDVGSWHLIALNSNCAQVACTAGSAQEQWLRSDLAAHPGRCTLAYWHHARFSSGHDGDNTFIQPFWQALYDAHADIVLNGHSHDYERFAPMNAGGTLDNTAGLREFIVGTGGAFFTGLATPDPNSLVRQNDTYGVLRLTLHPGSYDWQFVPDPGKTFTDSGSGTCHSAAGLSVTESDSPDPVPVGWPLTYALNVTNNGPAAAASVTLADVLPKNVRFRSAGSDHGRCAQAGSRRIECNLADLAAGETAHTTITVRPTKKGTVVDTATIQADHPADSNLADNTATATTQVTP